jgi:hypothetical protein
MRLRLTAATLGKNVHTKRVARHQSVMDDCGGVIGCVVALASGITDHGFAERIVRFGISFAHTSIDHLIDAQARPVPEEFHPDRQKYCDDTGILAHRPVAFCGHPRVYKDLLDRVFGCRRLLRLVCARETSDKINGMVVGDILQSVGHALDEIVLVDTYSHRSPHRRCYTM